jgi:hypothetical protein
MTQKVPFCILRFNMQSRDDLNASMRLVFRHIEACDLIASMNQPEMGELQWHVCIVGKRNYDYSYEIFFSSSS